MGVVPTKTQARPKQPEFAVGQTVNFAGAESVVVDTRRKGRATEYLLENGPAHLPMWVPAGILAVHQTRMTPVFRQRTPHILAVDDFFDDPDAIREFALAQDYSADLRYYKGLRSDQRYLWPFLREEFGRLLGTEVVEWLDHTANGVFQQTNFDDPLVWHHDTQGYAAAVYLTPDAPPSAGTSFWRERQYGCRRAPGHELEKARLKTAKAVKQAESVVYDAYNIEHPDNWELIESVAGLYNRLVIWDAALLHSATSYQDFSAAGEKSRLVQLFFFDTAPVN